MRCEHPVPMFKHHRNDDGKIVYSAKCPPSRLTSEPDIMVPCGKCFSCRFNRALEWRHRLEAESWAHSHSSFVTLTYRDDALALNPVYKLNVQRFIKRFRHLYRDHHIPLPDDFRYYFCLEFGSTTHRPHHHGILFGLDLLSPCWQPYLVNIVDGYSIYSSHVLESIWQHGFVTCDTLSPAVADYVTKYVLKQSDSPDLWSIYSRGLGLSHFFANGIKPSLSAALYNRFLTFGSNRHYYKSVVPKYLLRRVRSLDPDSYDDFVSRSRDFILSDFSDIRSASERSESQKILHKRKQEKRKLDNE